MKIALWVALGVAVVVFGGCSLLYWRMYGDHSSFSEHVDTYDGIPPAASDITVYKNNNISGVFIADFDIPEQEFVAWVASHGEKLKKLEEVEEVKEIADARAFANGNLMGSHAIRNGLYFEAVKPNNGGVYAAYCRDRGRGFLAQFAH